MCPSYEHVRLDFDLCILKPKFGGEKKKPRLVKWPRFKRTLCNVVNEMYAEFLYYSLVQILKWLG